MKIATETGAIKMDDEGEHFVSCYSADAEKRTYALATIRCRRHDWDADIEEVRETLKDILDDHFASGGPTASPEPDDYEITSTFRKSRR
jgi:hypothetical protein